MYGNKLSKIILVACICLCTATAAMAQTPIAIRVNAASKVLSGKGKVVARYKDRHRHGVYYIREHRLYFYDVMTNHTTDVTFTNSAYDKVVNSWLSPDGNYFFIVVDRASMVRNYLDAGQELWRYDSRTKRFSKIGQGFAIRRNHSCMWIKRATRCLNPNDPPKEQRWMAQNHYYDLYGKVIFAKEEYEINE